MFNDDVSSVKSTSTRIPAVITARVRRTQKHASTYGDDGTSVVVREVHALADLAPTHGQEKSTCLLLSSRVVG